MNIGKTINDGYCNGYFGRRFDLTGAIIEAEGTDWVVIRADDGKPEIASFEKEEEKQKFIDQWCRGF